MQDSNLTVEQLTGTIWHFGQANTHLWSTTFRFEPDGSISGYHNDHEVSWALVGDVLEIFSRTGELVWQFQAMDVTNGCLVLEGRFVLDDSFNGVGGLRQASPLADGIFGAFGLASGIVPEPKPQLLFVGDSHVWYHGHAIKTGLFRPMDGDVCVVLGATAVGMRNPENMTNSIGQFRDFLKGRHPNSVIVIHLGENDCGFVIWYRAQKYDESIEEQTIKSIGAYFDFVDELLAQGFKNIIITGSTMPTIEATDQGYVASMRASISATQVERTQLTHEYNRLLREQAAMRALPYVDITEEAIDPETGLVSAQFRNPSPGDHHMDFDRAASAWAGKLFPLAASVLAPQITVRAWTPAHSESFVKALQTNAIKLPPDLKTRVKKNGILLANFHGTSNEHHILSNVRVNGERLPPHLRLIGRSGWRPIPLLDALTFYSQENLEELPKADARDIFRTALK